MGYARGSGLRYFDSSIPPASKSPPLKSGEFESFLEYSIIVPVSFCKNFRV
jgi:hypothetical protein